MDLAIFLAKLFGLYFLIAGGIVMLRQKSFMPMVLDFFGSKAMIMLVGALELVAGLALVIAMFRNRETLNVDRSDLLKW